MSDTPIYDELAAEMGIFIPDPLIPAERPAATPVVRAGPITQDMPAVRPDEPITQTIPVVRPAEDLSWADPLVQASYNGLRPEDERLPQPPQDPKWRPSALG